jgi:hypothetical protein
MEELARLILLLLGAILLLQLATGGWGGVQAWIRAKFLGHPAGA